MNTDAQGNESTSNALRWDAYPFKSDGELFPSHSVGTFSSHPSVLQQIAFRPQRPTVSPDSTEIAILVSHFPECDPANPPWPDIQADLLAAGIAPETVKSVTSRQLVRILNRVNDKAISQPIPVEFRSRIMTLAEAARLHAGENIANPSVYFRRLIEKGEITSPMGTGRQRTFDIRDFHIDVQDQLRP